MVRGAALALPPLVPLHRSQWPDSHSSRRGGHQRRRAIGSTAWYAARISGAHVSQVSQL
jgi:hypothetical protein